jgi:hypothetical protein
METKFIKLTLGHNGARVHVSPIFITHIEETTGNQHYEFNSTVTTMDGTRLNVSENFQEIKDLIKKSEMFTFPNNK